MSKSIVAGSLLVLPMLVQNPTTDGPNDTPIPNQQGSPSASRSSLNELQTRCARNYADQAHRLYKRCAELAIQLDDAVQEFVKHPGDISLESAQIARRKARRVYGQTEVFRFYGGPIDNPVDGVETLVNAWPLDENYIDSPDSGTGIINDREHYPNLDATLLTLLNERGGEANVSIGWHAVEFLLWGVDTNSEGPGQRAWQDYCPDHRDHAERRGRYLQLCSNLLVQHHRQLKRAWDPALRDNYRARFLSLPPDQSFRHILAGMTILSGFELSGERLAVAYETQDQEEEHSCFSDNTHIDFLSNQEGIMAVFLGSEAGNVGGVWEVARAVNEPLAQQLKRELETSLRAIRAMPVPFDQSILGPNHAPNRQAVLRALVALERQASSLAVLGAFLGHDIALQPGG